eukprot:TRINITY_DN5827_c0_g1_i1.p1 TRINITY_DN5827_c0_g1~~TRINITY_DN5827_c0_g1_i1.p1  ORF type:complete len:259 (+),score=39.19 TRINITY_DN5827_c0_g1_i1:158-934(+)
MYLILCLLSLQSAAIVAQIIFTPVYISWVLHSPQLNGSVFMAPNETSFYLNCSGDFENLVEVTAAGFANCNASGDQFVELWASSSSDWVQRLDVPSDDLPWGQHYLISTVNGTGLIDGSTSEPAVGGRCLEGMRIVLETNAPTTGSTMAPSTSIATGGTSGPLTTSTPADTTNAPTTGSTTGPADTTSSTSTWSSTSGLPTTGSSTGGSPDQHDDGPHGLKPGAVVAIVVVPVGVALLGIVAFTLWRRHRRQREYAEL